MFDRKRISLPSRQRQYLYKKKLWKVGIDGDDVHYSHSRLNIGDNKSLSLTKLHRPCDNLKNIITILKSFYIQPRNDRKNAPDWFRTSKEYS